MQKEASSPSSSNSKVGVMQTSRETGHQVGVVAKGGSSEGRGADSKSHPEGCWERDGVAVATTNSTPPNVGGGASQKSSSMGSSARGAGGELDGAASPPVLALPRCRTACC